MAGRVQDRLLDSFREASGGELRGLEDVLGGTVDLAASLRSMGEPQAANASGGTYSSSANPVGSNARGGTSAAEPGGSGVSVGDIASTFFESGFGMAALVKGLLGLFGGGSDTPPPLEPYQMPSAIDFQSTETAGGVTGGDYGQTGLPRAVIPDSGGGAAANGGQAPQITVNVQAMDAQSFLDHSSAIAEAVRGAMLNLSSINDVVNEL